MRPGTARGLCCQGTNQALLQLCSMDFVSCTSLQAGKSGGFSLHKLAMMEMTGVSRMEEVAT